MTTPISRADASVSTADGGGDADEDVDAVVVGGGIAGLANGLALARAGQRVRVLERGERFGEFGAGIQLAPNATRILRTWGVLDEIIGDTGVTPRRLVLRDAVTGRDLTHVDLADAQHRYGAPYIVIHRSDLHAVLLRACQDAGVDLVTNTAVTDVDIADDHAVALSPGRRDRGKVVLAADGLHSTLRRRFANDEPVHSGYIAYRGLLAANESDHAAPRTSGDLSLDDVVLYIGPRCHLVQYPLRGHELINQVAVFHTPTTAAGPPAGGSPDGGVPDELEAAFAGTCAQVRDALAHLDRSRAWPVQHHTPLATWVDRRLALTGDAAHAMLQYLAQGACQAIEDADCLATHLVRHGGDWDTALRAYTDLRIPRATTIQHRVQSWGELLHADGLLRDVRNALLRDRDLTDYRHLDWLYATPLHDGPSPDGQLDNHHSTRRHLT